MRLSSDQPVLICIDMDCQVKALLNLFPLSTYSSVLPCTGRFKLAAAMSASQSNAPPGETAGEIWLEASNLVGAVLGGVAYGMG